MLPLRPFLLMLCLTAATALSARPITNLGSHKGVCNAAANDNGSGNALTAANLTLNGDCGDSLTIFSRDFPFAGTQFYLDNFIGQDLLAINPEQDSTAEVETTFTGASCLYDLTFHGVGENDGASSFKLFVDDDLVGDIVMPISTEPFELGPAYNVTFPNVALTQGAKVRVYAKVGTDGQEFSRARWLKIDFHPVNTTRGCLDTWEEDNGIVAIEMENGRINQRWRRSTADGGFSGTGFIEWTGNEFFNQTGNGVVRYPFTITKTGTYTFEWRVRVGRGTSNTEHNDTWWKITGEGSSIFARKTGALYKPKPDCNNNPDFDCPRGSTRDNYFKVYINNLDWRYRAVTSDNDPTPIFVTFDEPGQYEMVISARSSFHRIDRAVLYHSDVNRDAAVSASVGESQCAATDSVALTFVVSDGFDVFEGATVSFDDTTPVSGTTDENGRVVFTTGTQTINYVVSAPNRPDFDGSVSVGSDRTVLVTLPFITSVRDARPELNFRMFPNPASKLVSLDLPGVEETTVRLIDSSGRVVLEQVATARQVDIALKDLAAGVYVVEVGSLTGVGRRKLIVK